MLMLMPMLMLVVMLAVLMLVMLVMVVRRSEDVGAKDDTAAESTRDSTVPVPVALMGRGTKLRTTSANRAVAGAGRPTWAVEKGGLVCAQSGFRAIGWWHRRSPLQ